MRWVGLIAVAGMLACARAPAPGEATTVHKAETARDLALEAPCELAAAILGAGLRAGAGPPQTQWHATVEASCGDGARLSLIPVVLVLEPEHRELIEWGTLCRNGLAGPRPVVGGTMDFYDVEVTVRDATRLTFEVTPRYVEFDREGRKLHDVVQGCAALSGVVSPAASSAAQEPLPRPVFDAAAARSL